MKSAVLLYNESLSLFIPTEYIKFGLRSAAVVPIWNFEYSSFDMHGGQQRRWILKLAQHAKACGFSIYSIFRVT